MDLLHTHLLSPIIPPLPQAKTYPAGCVSVNAKKLADLKKLQNYVLGYTFYNLLQKWPKTQAQADNENSGDDGGA